MALPEWRDVSIDRSGAVGFANAANQSLSNAGNIFDAMRKEQIQQQEHEQEMAFKQQEFEEQQRQFNEKKLLDIQTHVLDSIVNENNAALSAITQGAVAAANNWTSMRNTDSTNATNMATARLSAAIREKELAQMAKQSDRTYELEIAKLNQAYDQAERDYALKEISTLATANFLDAKSKSLGGTPFDIRDTVANSIFGDSPEIQSLMNTDPNFFNSPSTSGSTSGGKTLPKNYKDTPFGSTAQFVSTYFSRPEIIEKLASGAYFKDPKAVTNLYTDLAQNIGSQNARIVLQNLGKDYEQYSKITQAFSNPLVQKFESARLAATSPLLKGLHGFEQFEQKIAESGNISNPAEDQVNNAILNNNFGRNATKTLQEREQQYSSLKKHNYGTLSPEQRKVADSNIILGLSIYNKAKASSNFRGVFDANAFLDDLHSLDINIADPKALTDPDNVRKLINKATDTGFAGVKFNNEEGASLEKIFLTEIRNSVTYRREAQRRNSFGSVPMDHISSGSSLLGQTSLNKSQQDTIAAKDEVVKRLAPALVYDSVSTTGKLDKAIKQLVNFGFSNQQAAALASSIDMGFTDQKSPLHSLNKKYQDKNALQKDLDRMKELQIQLPNLHLSKSEAQEAMQQIYDIYGGLI